MRKTSARVKALLLTAAWMQACAPTVAVTPVVEARRPTRPLVLPARYDGDPRHLPLSVVAVPDSDARFEYRYELSYEREDLGGSMVLAFMVFAPAFLLGYPLGSTKVTAVATLTARDVDVVVRTYEATAIVEQKRTLYHGDSLSDLRIRALQAARNNIEAQIRLDEDFLAGLAGEPEMRREAP